MLVALVWLSFSLGFVSSQGVPDGPVPCEGECPTYSYQHYYAKGCEPVFDDEVSLCCPARFDCSVSEPRDPSKCYHKGTVYELGETMNISNPCEINCKCERFFGPWAQANCINVECPTLFTPELYRCEREKSIDSCCDRIISCPSDVPGYETEEDLLTTTAEPVTDETPTQQQEVTCEVEGTVYTKGQEMTHSNDRCRYCLCNENFKNMYDGDCRDIDCGIDYRDRQELEEGCTPVYYEGLCCQVDWICENSTRVAAPPVQNTRSTAVAENSVNTCQLGSITANVNEELFTVEDNLRCVCSTPPEFTCVQYRSDVNALQARNAGVI